jgi:uncharacterized SAM-binding protein YcdF (DUF218 family)
MGTVLYAIACVAIPALWGVVMYYAFGYWERRRRKARAPELPPVDYSI